jgi:hypothetical protein
MKRPAGAPAVVVAVQELGAAASETTERESRCADRKRTGDKISAVAKMSRRLFRVLITCSLPP